MLKKVIIYSILCILLATTLGANIVCTLSSVQIEFQLSSEYGAEQSLQIQKKADQYVGSNMFFFKTSKIEAVFDDYKYMQLVSIEKSFPNKVVVKAKELSEVYALKCGEGYAMLDAGGAVLDLTDQNVSGADGASKIEIGIIEVANDGVTEISEVSFSNYAVGEVVSDRDIYARHIARLINFCAYLDEALNGIRLNVSKAYVYKYQSLDDFESRFVITTVEGVNVYVWDSSTNVEAKADAIADKYLSLDDMSKTYGIIWVNNSKIAGSNAVVCEWDKNKNNY